MFEDAYNSTIAHLQGTLSPAAADQELLALRILV